MDGFQKKPAVTRDTFPLRINPVIRFIALADAVWYGATGMLGPIFALFIADFIEGGGPEVAGVAAGILLLSRSITQIPVATLIDKKRGDADDFLVLFGFGMLASIVPVVYLFIQTPFELYLSQAVLGIAIGASYPASLALITRHIERGREATVWGIYYTLIDIAAAAAAAAGGFLAGFVGFKAVIIVVVLVSVIGTLLFLPAGAYIRAATRHSAKVEAETMREEKRRLV